ncbi:STAS domain-containing protein [Allokutzneria sp. NRRL B-24872]|uniref:STAS domain-containing protein n=1 Tax=Allokutzneria sp. NRRL B-24872 TaxID=1137961 RepID=UPI000A3AE31B|nr:STAS domain-containing protein [Allokutzneria sp. NRRL B-24872]
MGSTDNPSRAGGTVASVRITEQDVVTVDVRGEITSETAGDLARALEAAAVRPARTIELDLTEVSHLSLEGAALLAEFAQRCRAEARNLRVHGSPVVRHKLGLTGLSGLVPTSD